MNRLSLALLGLLAFGAGCSVSPEGLCDGQIQATCSRSQRCEPEAFEFLFDSFDDCVITARRFTTCSGTTEGDVCSNPEDYNGAAAAACLRETRSGECGSDSPSCDLICGE